MKLYDIGGNSLPDGLAGIGGGYYTVNPPTAKSMAENIEEWDNYRNKVMDKAAEKEQATQAATKKLEDLHYIDKNYSNVEGYTEAIKAGMNNRTPILLDANEAARAATETSVNIASAQTQAARSNASATTTEIPVPQRDETDNKGNVVSNPYGVAATDYSENDDGVRIVNYLYETYGITPGRVGFVNKEGTNGYITIDGKIFMSPDGLKDGMAFANEEYIDDLAGYFGLEKVDFTQNKLVTTGADNKGNNVSNPGNIYGKEFSENNEGVPIVNYLAEKYNIDPKRFGFVNEKNGNGYVTIDGEIFISPDGLFEGTSYNGADELEACFAAFLRRHPDGLSNPTNGNNANKTGTTGNGNEVIVAEYASANSATPVQFYDLDGVVYINGIPVEGAYIKDGKYVATQEAVDKAIAKAREASGIKTATQINNEKEAKYGGMRDDKLNDVVNYGPFEYSTDNDIAYQAYRDAYVREGDRAMRDAMGAMAGMTGGFMSSAAMTAGAQANNYYMQKLNDVIPQLVDAAFNRYTKQFDMEKDKLNSIMNVHGFTLGNELNANSMDIDNIRDNRDFDYKRRRDEKSDRQWEDYFEYQKEKDKQAQDNWDKEFKFMQDVDNRDFEYQQYLDAIANEHWNMEFGERKASNDIARDIARSELKIAKINAIMTNAKQRGYFTEEECQELGIPVGTSVTLAEEALNEIAKDYQEFVIWKQTQGQKEINNS